MHLKTCNPGICIFFSSIIQILLLEFDNRCFKKKIDDLRMPVSYRWLNGRLNVVYNYIMKYSIHMTDAEYGGINF